MIQERQNKLRLHQDRLKVRRGDIHTRFRISGDDFGFTNIVEAADALERLIVASKDDQGKPNLSISRERLKSASSEARVVV